MILLKNHNPGVSFIEVMVALMLVSLVIIASFKTQGSLLRTTSAAVNQVQAVAAIKDYFIQAQREAFVEKEGTQEKQLTFPHLKPAIMIEKVTATWNEFGHERTLTMVRFVHHPQAPETKKSGEQKA